jgi:VanZ family protein
LISASVFSRRNLGWKILSLLWALKIFLLSTEGFASDRTRSYFAQLLAELAIAISPALFAGIHSLVRKSAHLFEYGVLAFLLYRAVLATPRFSWEPRAALLAAAIAIGYSMTDELHQAFVTGRGGSAVDVGFDALGAGVAITLIYLYARIKDSSSGPDL